MAVWEGEAKNLIFVWISAVAALCYCHRISRSVAVGLGRLLCLLPVVILFILLPLNLTTITFGSLSAFFLAWLANFKIGLLAFGKGPLSPHLSLSHFIATACLPIKLHGFGAQVYTSKGLKPTANYAVKFLIAASFIPLFAKKERIDPTVVKVLYGIFLYLALELWLALAGAIARRLVGVDLEPQFDEPYLSTSLQDFWGRRWNLMVTSIMRPSVYDPVRSIAGRWIGRQPASLAGVFSTFLVSGVMHELMFYYIGRRHPTWVVTCFFLLHGVSVVAETMLKKVIKWRPPAAVSCPLTMAYVAATGVWLFVPPLLRCGAEAKVQRETVAALQFAKGTWEVVRFSAINILRK